MGQGGCRISRSDLPNEYKADRLPETYQDGGTQESGCKGINR